MQPTKILFPETYLDKFNMPRARSLSSWEARSSEDPTVFAYLMIGKKLYDYQDLTNNVMRNNRYTHIVKGRQLGFTENFAMFCLWGMFFNKEPTGLVKRTWYGFVSKDDASATKLPDKVRDLIYEGDAHIKSLFGIEHYFSSKIGSKNNTEAISLETDFGSSILESFPPTEKAIGNAFSRLFIDEAALLKNPNRRSWYDKVHATLAKSGGSEVISSTSRGYDDFFSELIDPDDKKSEHEGYRLCFPHTISQDPSYLAFVKKEEARMDPITFGQEYCCDFSVTSSKFFDREKVRAAIDAKLSFADWSKHDFICGIDYGIANSYTTLSLATKDKDTGHVVVPYVHRFALGTDNNEVIPFVLGLEKRYHIVKYVVDDSAPGNSVNSQLQRIGKYVELFDFHTAKEPKYSTFRSYMNLGKIKMLDMKELLEEFMDLEQEETDSHRLKIHKTSSGTDDIVASVVMACSPFLIQDIFIYYRDGITNIPTNEDPRVTIMKDLWKNKQKVKDTGYLEETDYGGYNARKDVSETERPYGPIEK